MLCSATTVPCSQAPQRSFSTSHPHTPKHQKKNKTALTPLYEHLCADLGLPKDEAKASAMRAANEQSLRELDAALRDAEENLGETEVRDALTARAAYLGRIGDRAAAAEAYAAAEAKTAGGGARADLLFAQARLAMLFDDWHAVKALLARARAATEAGGDWEHKNRLKVYEGALALRTRDFKRAAALLLDSVQTFAT